MAKVTRKTTKATQSKAAKVTRKTTKAQRAEKKAAPKTATKANRKPSLKTSSKQLQKDIFKLVTEFAEQHGLECVLPKMKATASKVTLEAIELNKAETKPSTKPKPSVKPKEEKDPTLLESMKEMGLKLSAAARTFTTGNRKLKLVEVKTSGRAKKRFVCQDLNSRTGRLIKLEASALPEKWFTKKGKDMHGL